jgi:signal transduction histidine kinase/ActR/RegA family two-component response regulator
MLESSVNKSNFGNVLREYAQYMQPAKDISPEKQVQLLQMAFGCLIHSLRVIPMTVILATLFYGTKHDITYMSVWALVYVAAFFYRKRLERLLDEDIRLLSAESVVDRWIPKVKCLVTLHGIGLCAPLLITAFDPSFEFTIVWYLVLAGIVAINATMQAAVLSIFIRFMNSIGVLACIHSVFAFPDYWYYVTPIVIFFILGFYRYALVAHKFILQQVRLEESSARLAEQFRQAKNDAEDALNAKVRFLATASHDLRQPVHAMSLLVEAISHLSKDTAIKPVLADLRTSLRALNLMFNSLLDLSKLESGAISTKLEPVHLQPFLKDVATLFQPDAQDRKLELRLRLPRQPAFAYTDANLLRQVVLNLTQNALRYTTSGGVLLGVRRRGEKWQIEVCDTGIGVAKDAQSDIYSPYFRHKHAWGIDSEGHGLGLSVVSRCALLLKSPLDMSSRLGRGSRFWIRVPSVPIDSASLEVAGLGFVSPSSSGKVLLPLHHGQCLIVEDDPQVSRAWLTLMLAWGVEARVASNSFEAFEILQSGFLPRAIFCDERLRAGESGFELLKALLDRCPDARGAMVSGEFNATALVYAEEEGYLVLQKPVDLDVVHDLLNRWIGPHPAQSSRWSISPLGQVQSSSNVR